MVDLTFDIKGESYILTIVPAVKPEPLKMALYSQNDPRWASSEYAPGAKFKAAGCLVCCLAMMYSLVSPDQSLPPDVSYALRKSGAFLEGLLSRPSVIPDALPGLLWGGAIHWRNTAANLPLIRDEIARSGATILEVSFDPKRGQPPKTGQHFVVATRVTDDQDVIIVDPWDGASKSLVRSAYALPLGWPSTRAIFGARLVRVNERG